MSEWRGRVAPWILCCLALLAVAAVRVWTEAGRELSAGERSVQAGDVPDAIRHLRRAAHWYFPGSPPCSRAFDRLESIATQAESQGRTDDAVAAWRAIRSSALATRWLLTPERERLARANRHLAALVVEGPASANSAERDRTRERDDQLALLNDDSAPEPAWIAVMGIGFIAWLAGAFWAARRGWNDQDRPNLRVLAGAAVAIVIGFGLFVLGIVRA